MLMKKALAGLLCIAALLFAWWWWAPKPKPPILLITIDTLRADRLGAYGNGSIETPNLDRIAAEGILFSQASATVPLTLPSHASILTGKYPFIHGVRDNGDFVLPASIPTLAERLRANGYETGAFVGSYVLASRFGLNRGFDTYDDAFGAMQAGTQLTDAAERRADKVIDSAMRWLAQNRESPFFCWIHLNDPHTPYDPPEPYRSLYPGRPYDGEIAFTDSALKPLLELLDRKGWYGKMVVIVAADHGESLGEHGESTHGYFIYESTMRVPLLLKLPSARMAGTWIDKNVSLIDVAPTILHLAHEKAERLAEFEGIDLTRSSADPRPLYGESEYARLNFRWSGLRSLRLGTWKYIEAPNPELYHLDQDPIETHNVFDTEPDVARQLRAELRTLASASPTVPVSAAKVEPSALARLRSLGYLAGAGTDASASGSAQLADPKAKLPIFEKMVRAQELIGAGQPEAAAKSFQEVLRLDSGITLAHHQLGGCYLALQRPADAAREFERAVASNPGFSAARFDLGIAQIQLARFQEAVVNFQRVLHETPKDYESLNYLAIALSGAGKDDDAMRALRNAIAVKPDFAEAYFNLGRLQVRAGDYPGARASFQAAQQAGFSSAQFHADYGWLLMEQKDVAAAIDQYLKALELNPDDPVVHNNLGFAFAQKGDLESAIRHYRIALKLNPSYSRAQANLSSALKASEGKRLN